MHVLPVFNVINDAKRRHLDNRLKQENRREKKVEELQYKEKFLYTDIT